VLGRIRVKPDDIEQFVGKPWIVGQREDWGWIWYNASAERLVSHCRIDLVDPGMDDRFAVKVIKASKNRCFELNFLDATRMRRSAWIEPSWRRNLRQD
jgi:hypothetical protein